MDVRISNLIYDIQSDQVHFDYVVCEGDEIKQGHSFFASTDTRTFMTVLADLTREDHEV